MATTIDTPADGPAPIDAGFARPEAQMKLSRRKLYDKALWGFCMVALLLIVAPVVSIVAGVAQKAVAGWQWNVLTTTTQGSGGGLANAVAGTFVIILGVVVIAGALGMAGGIYLAEYASPRQASILRGASGVLSGVPSIVLGYIGYTTLVVEFHWGFGLGAALVTLSILVVPYMVKSTESALSQVPVSYREGGEALGIGRGQILRKLVVRPALPGVATGIIFAVAIALGETAPLLYTANWSNDYPAAHLTHAPVGYLTYVVYQFYNEGSKSALQLSYDAAFLLVILVLLMMAIARVVVNMTQKHSPNQRQNKDRRRVGGSPVGRRAKEKNPG